MASSPYLAINQHVVSSTLFASLQVAVKSKKKREANRVQTHKSRFVLNPCATTLTSAVFITSGRAHVAHKCLLPVLTCLIYRPGKMQRYGEVWEDILKRMRGVSIIKIPTKVVQSQRRIKVTILFHSERIRY